MLNVATMFQPRIAYRLSKPILPALVSMFLAVSAGAVSGTESTVDPKYPATNDDIDAFDLRNQFQAAHDDIDDLFGLVDNITAGGGILNITGDVSASGSGSVPATVNAIKGAPLGSTSPGAGNLLVGSGSQWVSHSATGDCSISSSAGFVCGKTNGVPFAASATTDATNASNLVSGTVSASRMPPPTASTLGGIESISPSVHQWVASISTSGVPQQSQPSFSDLLGNVSVNQMNSGLSAAISTYWDGSGHWSVPSAAGITALSGDVIANGPGSAGASLANTATARGNIGLGASSSPSFAALNLTSTPLTPLSGGLGSNNGNASALYGYPKKSWTTYQAYGDSITCGYGATGAGCSSSGYATMLANDLGTSLSNFGVSGTMSCDGANLQVVKNANPGTTANPVYTYMIGTNDASNKGAGPYEAIYHGCHLAALSWMAIPSQFKVSSRSCSTTGTWTNNTSWVSGYGSTTSSSGSTMNCSISTFGGPVYAWYAESDTNNSTFTYALDNGPTTTIVSAPTPPIANSLGTNGGIGFIRLPSVTPGQHTINFVETAGNQLTIIGIGTPAPYPYWGGPLVYSGGVPQHQNDVSSADSAAYDADSQADAGLLYNDGLPVYFVPVRNYLNDTTDMFDNVHPNLVGHGHLRDAWAAAMQYIPAFANWSPPSNGACSAGQLVWDTGFIYVCTASGVWKRSALTGGY